MKIDDTDIREFSAKQLTVDYLPPQTVVNMDMYAGALIPSESETETPLSEMTVRVLFRGNTRNEIQRYVSEFNCLLQKGVTLTLDKYERRFKGYMIENTLDKTITQTRYIAGFTFIGYWFSNPVTLAWQDSHEMLFETIGNRPTPCKLNITALKGIEQLKINGFEDELLIKDIPRGATVEINGEKGLLTMDGVNKFNDVEGMMEFPYLKTGKDKKHHLIFSSKEIIVILEYKPIWL